MGVMKRRSAGLLVAGASWRPWPRPGTSTRRTRARRPGSGRRPWTAAIVASVSATGALAAVTTVQVGSQVSGQVREVLVDFNSPSGAAS